MPRITALRQGEPFSVTYYYSNTDLVAGGTTVTAVITNADGSWTDVPTATLADQAAFPGKFTISESDTSGWPLGPLECVVTIWKAGNRLRTFDDNFTVIEGETTSGGSGTAEPYVHTQSSEAAEWIVNHNLGHRPAGIEVLSPGGLSVNAEIVHISANQLRVYFVSPQTGSVLAL